MEIKIFYVIGKVHKNGQKKFNGKIKRNFKNKVIRIG